MIHSMVSGFSSSIGRENYREGRSPLPIITPCGGAAFSTANHHVYSTTTFGGACAMSAVSCPTTSLFSSLVACVATVTFACEVL